MSIARLAAIVLVALVAACAEPVPSAKAAYVGDWQAPDMWLSITADGHVSYARRRGSARTNINAPIQAFEGDDFIVGVGWMHTRFVVSRPPHLEGGVWKMTVDGVELTRGALAADRTV
jgi:hypothetical protein